ncbi:MAG: superoxide dismutase family protein [Thermoanaerobaculia bacterium]
MRQLAMLGFAGTIALAACAAAEETASQANPATAAEAASATLTGKAGSGVSGSVAFHAMAGGVHLEARVEGAPAGSHGFHLHETGDCSAADFSSAGAHFNPAGVDHGGPDAAVHHAGDLGNLEVGADGVGTLSLHSTQLAIAEGPSAVVGRAVILHENADDLTTQPTGNAGGRLACGVIAAAATP